MVVAAVAVVGVIGVLVLRRGPSPAPTPAATAPEAPTARKTFTLFVDSTPNGAEVTEDDKVLGSTPMQISVDNDRARAEPRKIIVRREGFQPYSILQGPSEDNVRIVAPLARTQAEAPAEAPPAKERPAAASQAQPAHAPKPAKPAVAPAAPAPQAPPAAPTPPPTAPPANPADIRLQR
jgi:serine/threonine-protein kinase